MTDQSGHAPDVGNLWDGDHNSEGFRYLALVSSEFARYLEWRREWMHGNPLSGGTADLQEDIGKRLVFVGQAMQEQGALRKVAMNDFGGAILERLARFEDGERVDLRTLVSDDDDDLITHMVDLALQDLARTQLVDVVRARPGRIGRPSQATTYAITVLGRAFLANPQLAAAESRTAIGGGDEPIR